MQGVSVNGKHNFLRNFPTLQECGNFLAHDKFVEDKEYMIKRTKKRMENCEEYRSESQDEQDIAH